MKLLLTSLCFLLYTGPLLHAQVASPICLKEVAVAYQPIDAQAAIESGPAREIGYQHRYVMRSDPKRTVVSGMERMVLDKEFYLHESPEGLVVSDAKEAFNWRQNQFVVYRTRASLGKAGLIPKFDPGIFEHCLVRECDFVPAPGQDSISFKRAFMTVDAAGQKKYQIADLEFVTNPHDTALVSVKVNFVAPSLYVWAEYLLEKVVQVNKQTGGAAAVFLNSEGKLQDRFEGAGLMDYR